MASQGERDRIAAVRILGEAQSSLFRKRRRASLVLAKSTAKTRQQWWNESANIDASLLEESSSDTQEEEAQHAYEENAPLSGDLTSQPSEQDDTPAQRTCASGRNSILQRFIDEGGNSSASALLDQLRHAHPTGQGSHAVHLGLASRSGSVTFIPRACSRVLKLNSSISALNSSTLQANPGLALIIEQQRKAMVPTCLPAGWQHDEAPQHEDDDDLDAIYYATLAQVDNSPPDSQGQSTEADLRVCPRAASCTAILSSTDLQSLPRLAPVSEHTSSHQRNSRHSTAHHSDAAHKASAPQVVARPPSMQSLAHPRQSDDAKPRAPRSRRASLQVHDTAGHDAKLSELMLERARGPPARRSSALALGLGPAAAFEPGPRSCGKLTQLPHIHAQYHEEDAHALQPRPPAAPPGPVSPHSGCAARHHATSPVVSVAHLPQEPRPNPCPRYSNCSTASSNSTGMLASTSQLLHASSSACSTASQGSLPPCNNSACDASGRVVDAAHLRALSDTSGAVDACGAGAHAEHPPHHAGPGSAQALARRGSLCLRLALTAASTPALAANLPQTATARRQLRL